MKEINQQQYAAKVRGCFIGKAVGGTLGGPYEGQPGPLELTYYDPVPQSMLPNDDLDLQVVWLEKLLSAGLPVHARQLADAWLANIHLYPDEYGIATRNLERGLYPPLSGAFDNPFTAGMGAAIRTELWACLAPGNPELAVRLAVQDAVVDHAGEGVYAAVFLAAIESLAFVSEDRKQLVQDALAMIPAESRVAGAIADTLRWCDEGLDWLAVRALILRHHGSQNFTDVAQNLAIIVLGLLAGTSFGKAVCIAVNCGCDTDCTGATLGALLGILAPEAIGEEWLKPIGMDVVLSPGMVGMHPAANLAQMCDQIIRLMPEVQAVYGADATAAPHWEEISTPDCSVAALSPLMVTLKYPVGQVFYPAKPETVEITIRNPYAVTVEGRMRVSVPYGWLVECEGVDFQLAQGQQASVTARITAPGAAALRCYRNDLLLDITGNGLQWQLQACLPQSTPWLVQELDSYGELIVQAQKVGVSHTLEMSGGQLSLDGTCCLAQTRFKLPLADEYTIVVQGNRPAKVFVDGKKLYDYAGEFFVPAMHRNMTAVPRRLTRGWHSLVVIAPAGEPGEYFVSIGNGQTWKLQQAVEWQLP